MSGYPLGSSTCQFYRYPWPFPSRWCPDVKICSKGCALVVILPGDILVLGIPKFDMGSQQGQCIPLMVLISFIDFTHPSLCPLSNRHFTQVQDIEFLFGKWTTLVVEFGLHVRSYNRFVDVSNQSWMYTMFLALYSGKLSRTNPYRLARPAVFISYSI
jgi:hypothetical protein